MMILFKNKNLDELQLRKRGDIFKHGLFTMGGLLMTESLLEIFNIFTLSETWGNFIIILLTITVCSIELIYHEIYTITEKKQKLFFWFLGVFGAVSIGVSAFEMFQENAGLIVNGQLSDNAAGIIFGCLFISVFFAYAIKKIYSSRHEHEE